MSFLDTVARAKEHLRRHGRVSLRALGLEFRLEAEELEALVEELVDVQSVAAREGRVLAWIAPPSPGDGDPTAVGPALAPGSHVEAERRHLTVLFCDLVDSTRLASGLDPEDWREVVRSYQQTAAEIVEEFDGYVAQYLGDGLLVYHGYPSAHEDDAERAVRAALGILDAVALLNERLETEQGRRLAVRIGIHTGPAVVGEVGKGTNREMLAIGDTTNIAARLQAEASADWIVISSDTLRLVEGIFITEELGRRVLKGISNPVTLHRVLRASGVRGRLDVARASLTPFVGRTQELGLLLDRWEQALEEEGQTVLLSGEAGVGKSRLVLALRERLADAPHTWLECSCSPYAQQSAFRPVIELLEHILAFSREERQAKKLETLEKAITVVGLDPSRLVPLVADLLGVPLGSAHPPLRLSPELQRERTLDALSEWILALAKIQPLVLVVEDLHWCDPSSLEFFGRLLEQIPSSRVLVVLTARSDLEAPWLHHRSWTPIALTRLRKRQARELVAAMCMDRPLREEVVSQIVERADGVALYLEELTRTALDSERMGAPMAIPATLRDSLMARLDRISSAKEIAQLGSVVGREFAYRLLESVSDLDEPVLREGLDRLVRADVLSRRGTPPRATYTFTHALIHETAYGSLLRKRRQDVHARVAQVLEEQFPERIESEPEELARHHAGAEHWERAVDYYARAGERATLRSAYVEAVSHLSAGIELLGQTRASPERVRRELALRISLGPPLIGIRGYGNPEVETTYLRARQLSEEAGDTSQLFESIWGLANYYQARSQLTLAKELGRQLVEIAQGAKDPQQLSWAHLQLGATHFWMGEYHASVRHLERAVESYDPAEYRFLPGGPDPCVAALVYNGLNLWQLGMPSRALESSRKGVLFARERDHAFSLAIALCFGGTLDQMLSDAVSVRSAAEEVIQLATDHGFPMWRSWGLVLLGWAVTHQCDAAGGVEMIGRALGEVAQTGSTVAAPAALMILADAQRVAGRWSDVVATATGGLALAEQQAQSTWDGELLRLKGAGLLEQNGVDDPEAEKLLALALETAQRGESQVYALRAAASLGDLMHRRGRGKDARTLVLAAMERFTGEADCRDLQEAKALLEEIS